MVKNQKGFSVVGILVVLVIVGLVGAVGWLVYDRQKNKTVDSELTSQTSQQEQKQETTKQDESKENSQAFFEIKELGVKFELSKAPKGLYYHIGDYGRTAYFSLEDLKSTDCAADKTAQVTLTRYTDEDFAEAVPIASQKDNAKKIGNYYYFSMHGQSGCSENAAIQEKATKLRTEIMQLLPSALVQM